jgi:hypothetical protein
MTNDNDLKFLDIEYFREQAEKIQAHYDKFGDLPNYPEDEVIEIIEALLSAANYMENFDWEQYLEDMKTVH